MMIHTDTPVSSYEEAVRYLLEIPYFTKKNDLAAIVRILELLGHPERFFDVIHVAGTNGKGSTCAFLERIFREEGKRTGLFTSPHLVRINERMRVLGTQIPDAAFLESFRRVREAVRIHLKEGGRELTFFETVFAMGMCWFQEEKIDLLICETGLGGRLDATNTIEKALAEVITSISLDHTRYLGDTVEQIAFEKAGIIRRRVPCIYSAKDPGSARVIREVCARMEAEPVPLEPDRYEIRGRQDGALLVRLAPYREEALDLRVPFAAQYQAENACLAALGALRLGARKGAVVSGIAHTTWPGRMEEISRDVFLDGAHNPDGIREIAREIRRIAKTRRVSLVTAIVSDKDYRTMVRELCRDVAYKCVTVTEVGERRKMDPEELAAAFRAAGQKTVRIWPDAQEAYLKAKKERGESVLFCVGSLYLIGEIQHAELRRRTEEVSSEHGCE